MACPGRSPFVGEYRVEDIQTLSGFEHVRLHPGMYIGSTDARGLFHLLFELVSRSLAEVVAGYGRSVRVAIRADGSAEVADDGRTLSASDPPAGVTTVEQAFTEFGYSYRGLDPYQLRLGPHDFEYVLANALSERLRVLARSEESVYQHVFTRGVTSAVLQTGGPPDDRGLTVAFLPDPLIFGDARFDTDAIRNRLRQLAFLHSGVRVTFADDTTGTRDAFEYADGVREYVQFLSEGRSPLHPDVIVLRGEESGVRYEVGLQWCEDDAELRQSFANHYHTSNGGTHDNGLRVGAAAAVRAVIRQQVPGAGEFSGDDLRAGLTAVVSVRHADAFFEGSTRARLGSPEVEAVVSRAVRRGVRDHFEANHEAAERVVRAVILARDVRVAARKIRRG